MLDWSNAGVCPDGIGPGHVVNGVTGAWESPLQSNDALDHGGRARGSHLYQPTLRADVLWMMGLWGLGVILGWSLPVVFEGLLC